jgi:hypothetical protein
MFQAFEKREHAYGVCPIISDQEIGWRERAPAAKPGKHA